MPWSSIPHHQNGYKPSPIVTVNANVCHTLLELPWLPQYIFIIITIMLFSKNKIICFHHQTINASIIWSLLVISIFITISLCNKKLRGDVINSVDKRDFCAMHQLLSFSLSPTLELSRSTKRTWLEHFLFVQTLSKTKLSLRALYRWINCTNIQLVYCFMLYYCTLHTGCVGSTVVMHFCTCRGRSPKNTSPPLEL